MFFRNDAVISWMYPEPGYIKRNPQCAEASHEPCSARHQIDWQRAQLQVSRLQMRIAKAVHQQNDTSGRWDM